MREAKRHHEGRGINACISLHKVKDFVNDVHWSSSNVNAWTPCEYEDHTYNQSKQNAINPTSHLFLKTDETSRESRLSHLWYQNKQDVLLGSSPGKSETIIHQKRTWRVVNVLRFNQELLFLMTLPHLDSHFHDPSTGKLKQNFVFVVDNVVDMPRSPLKGLLLVRLQQYLRIKKVTKVSFAEYHSK